MNYARSSFLGLRGLLRLLALVVVSLTAVPSFAFYAGAEPPLGWTGNPNGAATYNFSKKVGEAGVYASNGALHVRTSAAVQTTAGKVSAPAAMRFASTAGRFAAGKAFHPAVWLGMAAAPHIIEWATSNGFQLGPVEGEQGGQGWVKRIPGSGYRVVTAPAGFPQGITTAVGATPYDAFVLWAAAASSADPSFNYGIRSQSGNTAQMGKYTKAGGLYGVAGMSATLITAPDTLYPVTPAEFEQGMPGSNMPIALPPSTTWDWPVEAPVINPDPYPLGQPAPYYIPTGNPYWDPVAQKWRQSVLKVAPSPTTDNPWRVDIQPIEIELPTPAPIGQPGQPGYNPNPAPTPITNPSPDPLNPNQPAGSPITNVTNTTTNNSSTTVINPNAPPTGSTETPKPERQIQLCEAFPNILACEKLGTPPDTGQINKREQAVEITPQVFASSSACPGPITFSALGGSHEFTYTKMCETAGNLRALFLAIAGFIAAFIVANGFKVS